MTETIQLRGGVTARHPFLGRVPEFDEKSRDFPVRALMSRKQLDTLKTKTWYIKLLLDQGVRLPILGWDPSACTGYSAVYDLAASPNPLRFPNRMPFTNEFAFRVYQLARTLDEWAGENYEGSSVLGATKAIQKLGYVGEYRWAFGIDDACAVLSHIGGLVAGTDWQRSMFSVRPSGLIAVEGGPSETDGGHAYFMRGINVNLATIKRKLGKGERVREGTPLLEGWQSWGDWGKNGTGTFYIWADDFERLLKGIAYPGEARVTTNAFK